MNPFTLLTHASAKYAILADMSEPNKQRYCTRYAMKYVRINTSPYTQPWWRPLMWQQQLLNCEGFLFMGSDTLITNALAPAPKLGEYDMVLACDCGGINNDVFMVRSNLRTQQFMRELSTHGAFMGDTEQDAMQALLSETPDYPMFLQRLAIPLVHDGSTASPELVAGVQRLFDGGPLRVKLVPQRELNAYPQQYYGRPADTDYGWQPGDFAAHFPGLPFEDRVRGFKELLPQIVP